MTTENDDQQDMYAAEPPVSLSHLVHVLRRYAGVIWISIAGVVVAYAIVAVAVLLAAPTQKITTMPFRLEFEGATKGEYPNGLKFSVADITSTPVLLDVYRNNELARFVTFDQFARSLFVIEANRQLERLSAEFAAKLADPKLSPVDRDRIEREFESRRDSIDKSDYAMQFIATSATAGIPPTVIRKTLADTLASWARRAALEKRALDYQTAVLSPNIFADALTSDDLFVTLLLLRRRADDLIRNISDIEKIPGAILVRTRTDRTSLDEIRMRLDEIVRFRLEPLIATARGSGLLVSQSTAVETLRAQVAYDERLLASAQMRSAALRNTLAAYETTQPATTTSDQSALRSRGTPLPESSSRGTSETVMPQLSDTFLDRIVDLTSRTADREYRQKMTDGIRAAALAEVPLDAAVRYDHQLLDSIQAPPSGQRVTAAAFHSELNAVVQSLRMAAGQLNEIYTIASRQLYPETELFRTLGPASTITERTVSLTRVAVGGLLTILIAIPVIIIIVLLHNRVREEERETIAAEAAETST